MEDHKKKYEQALERARTLHKLACETSHKNTRMAIEELFPELKESEDDRMREMAIHAVCSPEAQSCIKSWGVEPKDVIAWLEKQGNQKPVNKVEPEPYFYCKYGGTTPLCSDCKRNHINSPFKTEEITTWYIPTKGTKQCTDYIAWLEKQGEQPNKVSIWKHWNSGIAGNGEGKLVYLIKNGSTYMLSSCLGCECDYIELSELDSLTLEKRVEQKPVPDDELSDFESALFSAFSDAWQEYLIGKEVNVAKWAKEHSAELLEVAREQKPAWSEEDEKIMNQIISNLEKCSVPGFPIYVGGIELGINWLKSIKERMKVE